MVGPVISGPPSSGIKSLRTISANERSTPCLFKDAKAVTATYLQDALNNLKSGKKINPNNTKAIGCSIKRVKV